VRLVNPESAKVEHSWKLRNVADTSACSADGNYIACGVVDGSIVVLDIRTRQHIDSWQGHGRGPAVNAAGGRQAPLLNFFADETNYILSAAGQTCKIWSIRPRKLVNTWDTTLITSITLSSDSCILAVGSPTGLVTIHRLPEGAAVQCVHAHRTEVWALALSPNGALLATASRDEPDGLKLFSVETWELVQVFRGHAGAVLDVAFSPTALGC
jgi:WD40 repeat protein